MLRLSRKTAQRAALLVAVLLCFALMFSVGYIAEHAEHDCAGEECEICTALETCALLLRSLGLAAFLSLSLIAARTVYAALCALLPQQLGCTSLIALKIELLN